jgi:hypothetical protein
MSNRQNHLNIQIIRLMSIVMFVVCFFALSKAGEERMPDNAIEYPWAETQTSPCVWN